MKAPRHGEAESERRGWLLNPVTYGNHEWPLIEQSRQRARAYFDNTFWTRAGRTGRLVYFCFCGAAPIALSRLVEVARRSGQTCHGMHVVALPWGDPITQASNADAVRAAAEAGRACTKAALSARCYDRMFKAYSKLLHLEPKNRSGVDDGCHLAAVLSSKALAYAEWDLVRPDQHRQPYAAPVDVTTVDTLRHYHEAMRFAVARVQSMFRRRGVQRDFARLQHATAILQNSWRSRQSCLRRRAWRLSFMQATFLRSDPGVRGNGCFPVDALETKPHRHSAGAGAGAGAALPPIPLEEEYKARRLRLGDLRALVAAFESLGGNVTFVPKPFDPQASQSDYGVHFGLRPTDVLFPICHAGQNRSQVMYQVLLGLRRAMGATNPADRVVAPHGALTGFDPYVGYENLSEDNFFSFVHSKTLATDKGGQRLDKVFRAALGGSRAPRLGEAHLGPDAELNPTTFDAGAWERLARVRGALRAHFDLSYWSRAGRTGRLVFVCFSGAAVIAMARLVEVAQRQGQSCHGMYIVALPWGDPVPQAGNADNIARAVAAGEQGVTQSLLTLRCYKHMFVEFAKLFYCDVEGSTGRQRGGVGGLVASRTVRPCDVDSSFRNHHHRPDTVWRAVHGQIAQWPAGQPNSEALYIMQRRFAAIRRCAVRMQALVRAAPAGRYMVAARRLAQACQTWFRARRALREYRLAQHEAMVAAFTAQATPPAVAAGTSFLRDALARPQNRLRLPAPTALEREYRTGRLGLGTLDELADAFRAMGGNVVFVEQPFELDEDPVDYGLSIGIRPSDVVFPICHAGQNRSQVMHRVLLAAKQAMGVDDAAATVVQPHGSMTGYDPYTGYEGVTADNFFQFVHGCVRSCARMYVCVCGACAAAGALTGSLTGGLAGWLAGWLAGCLFV